MNAKQETYQEKEALALASAANDLYAAKGKKRDHLDLKKDKPEKADILKLMLGPTGNLRAPTLRLGKTLVVGFSEEMYNDIFG